MAPLPLWAIQAAQPPSPFPQNFRGHPVTRIEAEAFKNCYDLFHVNIPGSITFIGQDAFKYCGRKEDEERSRATGAHSRRDLEYMFGYGCEGVESKLIGYQMGLYDGYTYEMTASVPKGSYAEHYCRMNDIQTCFS